MLLALLLSVFAPAGCNLPQQSETQQPQRDPPAYAEVVRRYNRNLRGLDRMWSRAVVEVRWQEADGDWRYEQGDASHLMVVLPDKLALSVAKGVGGVGLWIGCDASRYWVIDLLVEPQTAYVGRHELFDPRRLAELPLLARPRDWPWLMGLQPLPEPVAGRRVGTVRWDAEGRYLVEPLGVPMRLHLDPISALPHVIELIGARGETLVRARLSAPGRVKQARQAPGGWPRIMTRAEIVMADREGWLRLHLSDMTDARGELESGQDAALENAFDFRVLVDALGVERVVDVDARSSGRDAPSSGASP